MLVALVAVGAVAAAALAFSPRVLHIYVSNQSFADPFANLTVSVDGVRVVAGSFFVANEHNWTLFHV